MLTLLAAAAALRCAAAAVPAGSQASLEPVAALAPGSYELAGRLGLEDALYPDFELRLAQGMAGNLEFQAQGLFHHMRFTTFGTLHQYDFDETQLALKWTALGGAGGGLGGRGGWSRFRERLREGTGAPFDLTRTFRWGEATAGVTGPFGVRLTGAFRALRREETGDWIEAVVGGVELPPVGKLVPLGEAARFVRRPGARAASPWPSRTPWAAGARLVFEGGDLLVYASDTWGSTAPDALYGARPTFLNVRITVRD